MVLFRVRCLCLSFLLSYFNIPVASAVKPAASAPEIFSSAPAASAPTSSSAFFSVTPIAQTSVPISPPAAANKKPVSASTSAQSPVGLFDQQKLLDNDILNRHAVDARVDSVLDGLSAAPQRQNRAGAAASTVRKKMTVFSPFSSSLFRRILFRLLLLLLQEKMLCWTTMWWRESRFWI